MPLQMLAVLPASAVAGDPLYIRTVESKEIAKGDTTRFQSAQEDVVPR